MRTKKARTKKSNPPEPQLYPYQRRWVEDESRFKIACKARQIGFSFAAAWRVVDKRLQEPGLTVWLSASERQALEAMEHIRRFCRELRAVAVYEESFVEGTLVKQHQVRLPNGSRIVALPANPDTVRGFAGDVVLDEFAFHRDAEAIWRAAFATATRGFQLEVISTPNGTRGKYYELARAAGLVDSDVTRDPWPVFRASGGENYGTLVTSHEARSLWSPHWVDLATARAQGFVVDPDSLRAAIGDEDAWQQEYCCGFFSEAAHYLPPELVVAAEHPEATVHVALGPPAAAILPWLPGTRASLGGLLRRGGASAPPKEMPREAQPWKGPGETPVGLPQRPCYLGVDIGRRRDLTVLWLVEVEDELAPPSSRRYITRGIVVLDRQPFSAQRQALDALLAEHAIRRCAIDATGLGAMLAEELQQKWGARVEPVQFTLGVKEDLAVRVKRLLEERRLLLPADAAVRAALGSVKRYITPAGNIRFDADRTEATGHADHFWALALSLLAAEEPTLSVDFVSTAIPRPFSQAYVF